MQQGLRQKSTVTLPDNWLVACHTDNVGKGSIFVAIRGSNVDGARFIVKAVEKGATSIVVHKDTLLSLPVRSFLAKEKVAIFRVADTRLALAQLSAQAYSYPAKKLKIIGITGTKGKTTTAHLSYHVLRQAGFKVALLSTVENKINDCSFKATLTTAHPDYLHMFFDQCVKQGVTHVVMEVAAQAFSLSRVHGLQFDIGLFTNFAHEHLEFYSSMKDYFAAKCKLFECVKAKAPVIVNGDDDCLQQIRYAHKVSLSLSGIHIKSFAPKIVFNMDIDHKTKSFDAPYLMGMFNIYNILFAIHVGLHYQLPVDRIHSAIKSFIGVKGRMQRYALANGSICYIDYAHTPDSYSQVLGLLRMLTDRLIVVFGCGGLRDKKKRPLMGLIASRIADKVILTSDNPRTEDPYAIIDDIKAGILSDDLHKVNIVLDRDKAIEEAYACSIKSAIIVVLGKGPDAYQVIGNTYYDFSDERVIQSLK